MSAIKALGNGMIDWDSITVKLDQDLIDSQLYRHHFPYYTHMAWSVHLSSPNGELEVRAVASCGEVRSYPIYDHLRFSPHLSHSPGNIDFVPGALEAELRFTRDFDIVTCPMCKENYPLQMLGTV